MWFTYRTDNQTVGGRIQRDRDDSELFARGCPRLNCSSSGAGATLCTPIATLFTKNKLKQRILSNLGEQCTQLVSPHNSLSLYHFTLLCLIRF